MLFQIDHASPLGLSEQISGQIRAGIVSGDLAAGERLPPARELGRSLQVNMHTVLKAYAVLRDDGLLELRRGSGARVTEGVNPALVRLTELTAELAEQARKLGLSSAELIARIEGAYPAHGPQPS